MSMPQFPGFPDRPAPGLPQGPMRAGPQVPRYRMPTMLALLGILTALLITPYLAQEIAYAITRGEERAKYDVARAELAANPPGISPYRQAAKIIEPSVVGIDTLQRVVVADEWSFVAPRKFEKRGVGSGVVIDAEGYILTNSHVVADATQVDVKLSDGRIIKDAEVVGIDPIGDLAVVKITAGNLTPAHWGNSRDLEVGDEVLAVGNPFGLEHSVTAGIISATSRVDPNQRERSFIQTDAAVNPGNSGGPLVNLSGEVVGINTAIVGPRYQGVSFAIPSQLAQPIYEELKTKGSVARGYIGAQLQDLTPQLAERFHMTEPGGVLITRVLADSPAAKAGIQPGDLVIAVGDKKINDGEDLRSVISQAKIGDTLKLVVLREEQRLEIPVTVAQRPSRGR